ncbi:MAG: DUF899 domain-containing protein [Gemmatimonadetes bacterium]|nr:DUF899 domain-containing protein [Gemmatimonadota bacterium]
MAANTLALPQVVSREEWVAVRTALLTKEKELTRARDVLNAQRRRLPMVEIEKDYTFEGPAGSARLPDLFEGRRQLIVYHFMFDPSWDQGCPSCSFLVDNIGHLAHLHARNTTLVLVSRAPLAKIEPYKARMGWALPWFSSHRSDFNYDFHATFDKAVTPAEYNYRDASGYQGEGHGVSVFLRDGDRVFHTYSAYGRGTEALLGTYHYLDWTPFGRQEDWEDSPEGWPQTPTYRWLRQHDRYDG